MFPSMVPRTQRFIRAAPSIKIFTSRMNVLQRSRERPPGTAMATQSLDWLTRFAQDAQNQSTPIGAFLATLPQAPKRTAKSSSERGKAFRERQRLQEERLEKSIALLKAEIAQLVMRCSARETRCLNTRMSLTGSLAQTTCEYHRLFRHGLMELPEETARVGAKRYMLDEGLVKHIQLQEEFVRCTLDETAVVGDTIGPEASIVQWRRYTQSHESLTLELTSVQVHAAGGDGDEEGDAGDVVVVAHCNLRVRLSHGTFRNMFPHVLQNESFLKRMVGKDVTYAVVRTMHYAHDGRVVTERVDVDFVGGLVNAGCSLADIAFLMGSAAISSESMIVEVQEDAEPVDTLPCDREVWTPPPLFDELTDDEITTPTKTTDRLSLAFLLSDASAA